MQKLPLYIFLLLTSNVFATPSNHSKTTNLQRDTFPNGILPFVKTKAAWLSLDMSQLFRKGIALSYEKQFSKNLTYQLELGTRWHDFGSPGFHVYEYEEIVKTYFVPTVKTFSAPGKPADLGEFLPTVSGSLKGSIRLYSRNARKTGFFVQPSIAVFHHRGYNIQDNLTLVSEHTDSESAFFSNSTTYRDWRLERRIEEKSSRTTLNTSLTLGCRIVLGDKFALDMGASVGRNFGGINDKIDYHGLRDPFLRGFVTFGWRIQ